MECLNTNNKVFRAKKDHVLTVDTIDTDTLTDAFRTGYMLVKLQDEYYMVHTDEQYKSIYAHLITLEVIA